VAEKIPAVARRWSVRAAALALLVLAGLPETGGGPLVSAAVAAPRVQQINGTWDAVWQNSRGAPRKGLIVVEQRGSQLSARVESHGNVTATGSIAGSFFTLRGTRSGIPFTITGRAKGRKMSGSLDAILIERSFTATRRRNR